MNGNCPTSYIPFYSFFTFINTHIHLIILFLLIYPIFINNVFASCQTADQCFVQFPTGLVINCCNAGIRLFKLSLPDQSFQPVIFAIAVLDINKHTLYQRIGTKYSILILQCPFVYPTRQNFASVY